MEQYIELARGDTWPASHHKRAVNYASQLKSACLVGALMAYRVVRLDGHKVGCPQGMSLLSLAGGYLLRAILAYCFFTHHSGNCSMSCARGQYYKGLVGHVC